MNINVLMKKHIFFLIIFICIGTNIYSADDDYIEKTFKSPSGQISIIYKGAYYRGSGTFYLKRNSHETKIITTKVYYGPMVKWHSENYVEFFIPYGSPFNGSYIFKISQKKLTKFMNNVLYIDTKSGVIFYSDFSNIIVKGIFGDKIYQKIKLGKYAGTSLCRAEYFIINVDHKFIYIKPKYTFDGEEITGKLPIFKFRKKY